MLWRQERIVKLVAVTILMAMLLATAGCGSSKAVAVVNGENITRAQLDSYMNILLLFMPSLEPMLADKSRRAILEDNILESMIEHILVKQAAVKLAITITDEEVEEVYQQTKMQLAMMYGQDELNKKMKDLKIAEKDLREFIGSSVYSDKLFLHFADAVTDVEAQAYLAENPMVAVMIEISHILLDTEEEANDVRARLLAGEDFGELAEELSVDPSAQMNKGYLETIPAIYPDFDSKFMNGANALEVGELSMPIESGFGYGWHIIKLHSRTELSFEEIRDSIAEEIANEKFNGYLTMIATQADIKYN